MLDIRSRQKKSFRQRCGERRDGETATTITRLITRTHEIAMSLIQQVRQLCAGLQRRRGCRIEPSIYV